MPVQHQRSSSQQGRASPGLAGRFTSPGATPNHNNSTQSSAGLNSATRGPSTASQQGGGFFSATTSAPISGGGFAHHHQSSLTTSSSPAPPPPPLPAADCVSMEDFLQLKRALERERGQREEAVSRLREELYEMKEARRREKLDSAMAFMNSAGADGGTQHMRSRGGGQSAMTMMGGGGGGGASAGSGFDNSILGRLSRVELFQAQTHPQQLEAFEDRIRSRLEETTKKNADISKSEFKKFSEKVEHLNTMVATTKKEEEAKFSTLENRVNQISSTVSKTSSQVDVLHTHRIHDGESIARVQKDVADFNNNLKELEKSVHSKVEGLAHEQASQAREHAASLNGLTVVANAAQAEAAAATRGLSEVTRDFDHKLADNREAILTLTSEQLHAKHRNLQPAMDEDSVAAIVEHRLQNERDHIRDLVSTQTKQVEVKLLENHSNFQNDLQQIHQLSSRIDNQVERFSAVERRCSDIEAAVQKSETKGSDSIGELEARVETMIQNLNAANHSLLKDLNNRFEAQLSDKVGCSRDELEADVAQQLQIIHDRADETNRQLNLALQQQQQYVRSVVASLEGNSSIASLVVDGMEAFVRDSMQHESSSSSSASASVYSTCLERIMACRSSGGGSRQHNAGGTSPAGAGGGSSTSFEESGPTMADALNILYLFQRAMASSLNAVRNDVGDVRSHIGLSGIMMMGGGGGGGIGGAPAAATGGAHHSSSLPTTPRA